jgi:hypothetical protein
MPMPRVRPALRLAALLAVAMSCSALAAKDKLEKKDEDAHRFAIIGHSFNDGGEQRLKAAIDETEDKSTAFVVVTGIKGNSEPCSDKLYQQRHTLIDAAPTPSSA